ncbi:MAG: hypothetical protein V1672_00050 [Candidatus Diapherotrites archaeon]
MIKRIFFVLILVIFAIPVYADFSSQDAINHVTGEYYLDSVEKAIISPEVQIKNDKKSYWVVSVTSNNALVDFIPLSVASLDIPVQSITQRNLFKTAYFLREFTKLDEDYSWDSDAWLFTSANSKFMSDTANELSTEKIDLSSVKTELAEYQSLQIDVDSLISKLTLMVATSNTLSNEITSVVESKLDYFNNPDTNATVDLIAEIEDAFDTLENLDTSRKEYEDDLRSFHLDVSQLTQIPLSTRKFITSVSAVPSRFSRINVLAINATQRDEKINEIYNTAVSKTEVYQGNLGTRIKKNNVYNSVYGVDTELSEETGFTSLSQGVETILHEYNRYLWAEDVKVIELETRWNTLNSYLGTKKYDLSESIIPDIKESVILIYKAGVKEDDEVDTTLLFYVGAGLLIIIAVIYVIRNRGKFASLMRLDEKTDERDEVELDGWQKY